MISRQCFGQVRFYEMYSIRFLNEIRVGFVVSIDMDEFFDAV